MKNFLLFLSITCVAATAQATSIVADSFGPGDTYQSSKGFDVGTAFGSTYEQAAQFTAAASGNLTTIDLGLTYDALDGFAATPVNVYLYDDFSGAPNNSSQTLLGSGTPTAAFKTTGTDSLVSFSVAGTVPVTIGHTYWLVLKPASSTGLDVWNASAVAAGNVDESTDDSTWSTITSSSFPFTAAFRISASPIATIADSGSTFLLLLGAVSMLLIGQRALSRRDGSGKDGGPV